MSSRGVHFAITKRQRDQLYNAAFGSDDPYDVLDERVLELVQAIEEKWNRESLFETDKSWDGIHRCLTGDNTKGGRLDPRKGEPPLNLCILGGNRLYAGSDYDVNLIEAPQVSELAKALKAVDENWMRERFFKLTAKATQFPINEEEFGYVWGNFQGLPEFFAKAARKKRAVIFTVDH